MIHRRDFVRSSVALGVGVVLAGSSRRASGAGIAHLYADLHSERFFEGPVRLETRLADPDAFTEGPAVAESGEVFFTNIPAAEVLAWHPGTKTLRVARERSGNANGLLFDPNGHLLACEGAAGRVTSMDLGTGEITVLADEYEGLPLEAPNDLVQDRKGRIYFTSRPAGSVERRGNVNAVYRIDPDGSLHQVLRDPEVHVPNGVALSPDEATLYLIDADGGEGRNRSIAAYDRLPDGGLTHRRPIVDFSPGRSGDGMCVDGEGHLYVAAGLHALRGTSETLDTRPGIHAFSPEGRLLAFVETPRDTVTNCTFGGPDRRTLYVTCGPLLLSVRTRIPGLARRQGTRDGDRVGQEPRHPKEVSMRMILDFKMPLEPFNSMVKKGTAGQAMQKVLGALKAEAVYFTARGGCRGGTAIVDVADASKIPSLAEPLFLTFNASVELYPCMTPEELGKAGLEDLGKAFG